MSERMGQANRPVNGYPRLVAGRRTHHFQQPSGRGLRDLHDQAGRHRPQVPHAFSGQRRPLCLVARRRVDRLSQRRGGFKDEAALHPHNAQPSDQIYVMRADGSDVRQLTDDPFEHGTVAFAPVGKSR